MKIVYEVLQKATEKVNLTADEASEVMNDILDGKVDPVLTSALLVALRMKGENSAAFKANFIEDVRFNEQSSEAELDMTVNGFNICSQNGPLPDIFSELLILVLLLVLLLVLVGV